MFRLVLACFSFLRVIHPRSTTGTLLGTATDSGEAVVEGIRIRVTKRPLVRFAARPSRRAWDPNIVF